jgi:hypothetical protein
MSLRHSPCFEICFCRDPEKNLWGFNFCRCHFTGLY